MSDLFRVRLDEVLADSDNSGPMEKWSSKDISISALTVQIGILERLELMIELQSMGLDYRSSSPEGQLLVRIKDHFGRQNVGA